MCEHSSDVTDDGSTIIGYRTSINVGGTVGEKRSFGMPPADAQPEAVFEVEYGLKLAGR
jgi:hypothetical protein